jgi:hypothetical protein
MGHLGRAFEERSCGITGCGRWPKRLGRGRESVDNVGRVEAIEGEDTWAEDDNVSQPANSCAWVRNSISLLSRHTSNVPV